MAAKTKAITITITPEDEINRYSTEYVMSSVTDALGDEGIRYKSVVMKRGTEVLHEEAKKTYRVSFFTTVTARDEDEALDQARDSIGIDYWSSDCDTEVEEL